MVLYLRSFLVQSGIDVHDGQVNFEFIRPLGQWRMKINAVTNHENKLNFGGANMVDFFHVV